VIGQLHASVGCPPVWERGLIDAATLCLVTQPEGFALYGVEMRRRAKSDVRPGCVPNAGELDAPIAAANPGISGMQKDRAILN
jgi:hypothetical protein